MKNRHPYLFAAILAFLLLLTGINSHLSAAEPVSNPRVSTQPSSQGEVSKEYVKIFFYIDDVYWDIDQKNTDVETRINRWLSQEGEKIKIVRVCQSQSQCVGSKASDNTMVTISIFYRRI